MPPGHDQRKGHQQSGRQKDRQDRRRAPAGPFARLGGLGIPGGLGGLDIVIFIHKKDLLSFSKLIIPYRAPDCK